MREFGACQGHEIRCIRQGYSGWQQAFCIRGPTIIGTRRGFRVFPSVFDFLGEVDFLFWRFSMRDKKKEWKKFEIFPFW